MKKLHNNFSFTAINYHQLAIWGDFPQETLRTAPFTNICTILHILSPTLGKKLHTILQFQNDQLPPSSFKNNTKSLLCNKTAHLPTRTMLRSSLCQADLGMRRDTGPWSALASSPGLTGLRQGSMLALKEETWQ